MGEPFHVIKYMYSNIKDKSTLEPIKYFTDCSPSIPRKFKIDLIQYVNLLQACSNNNLGPGYI